MEIPFQSIVTPFVNHGRSFFIHKGIDKGLSVKESCALLGELADLVDQGRGNEWIAIAQDVIHKANNN
ncbi:hypothetical protein SZ39_2666 [Bacillus mycoides]|nr:hypothetical protein SZ39_2666 [Bacillus mycoides]